MRVIQCAAAVICLYILLYVHDSAACIVLHLKYMYYILYPLTSILFCPPVRGGRLVLLESRFRILTLGSAPVSTYGRHQRATGDASGQPYLARVSLLPRS